MKFRRRKFIVDKGLQIRFTLLFVLVSLLGSFAAVTAFNSLALRELEILKWSTHLNVKTTGEFLNHLFVYVNIADFMFVSVLLIIAGVWMKRKVSGPLYRMSKDIMSIAIGDLTTTIILRKKDDFKDVALELKIMVKGIRERFAVIKKTYTGLSKTIIKLKYEISDPKKTTGNCSSILKDIESIKTEIKSFKLRQKQ
ncbi:MAG: hypothetical protein L0956_09370 [Candidatus Mariimomonas ferrooxydans]